MLAISATSAVHLRRQRHVIGLENLAALTGEGDEGVPGVLDGAPPLALGQGLSPLVLDLPGDAGGRTFQAVALAEVLQDLAEVLVAEAAEGHLELFLACFHVLAPFGLEVGSPTQVRGVEKKPESGSKFELPPMTWGIPALHGAISGLSRKLRRYQALLAHLSLS